MWCCRWHLASEGRSVSVSFIALHPPLLHPPPQPPGQGSIIQWTNISWAPTMCWACARYGGGKRRDKPWGTGLWILHENLQCQAVFGTRCISMLTWAPGTQPRVTGWGWWGEGVSVGGEKTSPPSSCCHGHLKTSSLWKSLTSTHLHNPHRFCC